MNIAVILSNHITQGGGFQQELSTILLLQQKQSFYNFCFFTTKKQNIKELNRHGMKAKLIYSCLFFKLIDVLFSSQFIGLLRKKLNIFTINFIDKRLNKENIDLVYFLSPCEESLLIENHNYIVTVWDLCHRDNVEFPEVSHFRKFETRELFYSRILPKAFKIISDSEYGAKSIERRYNIDENRIISIPFMPSNSVLNFCYSEVRNNEVKAKYQLDKGYIFYPAQFWPHKNHSYILDGIKTLKESYKISIKAVFCGSKRSNYQFINQKAKLLGIDDLVINLGFVENDEIPYLYHNAIALVMPTYFGSTNIPPLEAFKLNCPVIYSDLPYLKEQVKDAVFYTDLKKPENLASHIMSIINRDLSVNEKIKKGQEIVNSLSLDKNWEKLNLVFEEYQTILKCWKLI